MENVLGPLKAFNPAIGLLLVAVYAITDALYAQYTLEVAGLNEIRAATTGAAIHFLIAFGVINYTHNWLYIFPLAIGSWIGTFMIVRRERLKKTKETK